MSPRPDDARWMALALSLGRRGHGNTWPNPAVGALVIKDGRVLGRGWTRPGGRPHGEVVALAEAGIKARGATIYVTLEPCAHHGKTPPCAEALVRAGVARVVSALEDPDPRVAGKGHALLRQAGIVVDVGGLAKQAARDHAGFLARVTRGRPFVTLKLASSFDGRIATATGESRWITGQAARRHVHYLRATHDAVMVGSGTSRADDPQLLVRDLGVSRQPVRIVCDTRLASDPNGQLGQSARAHPVILCHGAAADTRGWAETGARMIACQTTPKGHLELPDVLARLAGLGLTRIFCEGGGTLAAGLLAAGLVDQLVGYTAGLVLGGGGVASVAALPECALADHPRFRLARVQRLGEDVLHVWTLNTP